MKTQNKKFLKCLLVGFLVINYFLLLTYLHGGAAGTTGAQFLKLSIGARAAALGESFVGLSDDINSIYWNPAGLTNLTNLQVTVSGTISYENVYYGFLGIGRNISDGNAFGLGVTYLGIDKMRGYDVDGNPTSDYTANDIAVALSYAWRLRNISFGITAKAIQQKIADATADSFGVDFGGLYNLQKITFGLALQNFGPQIGFNEKFNLPTSVKFGFSYKPKENLILLSDLNFPFDYTPNLHVGTEFVYKGILVLRLGFRTTTIDTLGILSAFSAGIGIKIERINFDYAILPYGDLGLTHRISILLHL